MRGCIHSSTFGSSRKAKTDGQTRPGKTSKNLNATNYHFNVDQLRTSPILKRFVEPYMYGIEVLYRQTSLTTSSESIHKLGRPHSGLYRRALRQSGLLSPLDSFSHLLLRQTNGAPAFGCHIFSQTHASISAQTTHRLRQENLIDFFQSQIGRLWIEEVDDRTEECLL